MKRQIIGSEFVGDVGAILKENKLSLAPKLQGWSAFTLVAFVCAGVLA
jgi:hypothetical protein